MVAGCMYVIRFEDMRKAVDVVYDREKRKEMEEKVGFICKMKVERGKVRMVVVGDVDEEKFVEVVEDVFRLEVVSIKKEEMDIEEGSEFLWDFGEDVFYKREVEVEKEEEERLNVLRGKIMEKEEERKGRSRSFVCFYYCDLYGKIDESVKEICRKVKDVLGFEFVFIEEVLDYMVDGVCTYCISSCLHAVDYEDARNVFSYGLYVIRNIIIEATGHLPIKVRIGRINKAFIYCFKLF